MSSTDDRARLIYDWLLARQGQRFTIGQLCQALNIGPGGKTTQAIRRARSLASQDGLHFPPAVPANQFTYTVTALPLDAIDPAVHMSKIAAGVQARAEVGFAFAERLSAELPPEYAAMVAARQTVARNAADALRVLDDLVVEMARARRRDRADRHAENGASS